MSWKDRAASFLAAKEIITGGDTQIAGIRRSSGSFRNWPADHGHDNGSVEFSSNTAFEEPRKEYWRRELSKLRDDTRFSAIGDPDYPSLLAKCWDSPPFLFYRGTLPLGPLVAIVGSRSASAQARETTTRVARVLAECSIEVLSGLAVGVDTAAHLGALNAGGRTSAVLGTGLQKIYPAQNLNLAEEIACNGALISQFDPGAGYKGESFLARNRVIAGMSSTSIVVSAKEQSGSRNEAEAAVSYGRRVLLWEPELGDQQWARTLVAHGNAEFFSRATEVLEG